MAFLGLSDTGQLAGGCFGPKAPAAPATSAATASHGNGRFSPLEQTVLALATRDSRWSLATPGRLVSRLRALLGVIRDPRLADPRLETLRRVAVLARTHGKRLPVAEVDAFFTMGFSRAHLDTLLHRIELDHVFRAKGRLA